MQPSLDIFTVTTYSSPLNMKLRSGLVKVKELWVLGTRRCVLKSSFASRVSRITLSDHGEVPTMNLHSAPSELSMHTKENSENQETQRNQRNMACIFTTTYLRDIVARIVKGPYVRLVNLMESPGERSLMSKVIELLLGDTSAVVTHNCTAQSEIFKSST